MAGWTAGPRIGWRGQAAPLTLMLILFMSLAGGGRAQSPPPYRISVKVNR